MTARCVVDLAALRHNYRFFCDIAPSAAVLKADAYGAGAVRVAQELFACGCGTFFVATLDEALALRALELPDCRIFVFSGPAEGEVEVYLEKKLIPVLNTLEQLSLWRGAAGSPAALHVDTGMQRLGLPAAELATADVDGLNLQLVLSHYAEADCPDSEVNFRQQQAFMKVCGRFPGVPTSLGNSAAYLAEFRRSEPWVGELGRPGIGLYGGNPTPGQPNPLQAVISLQGQVLQIKSVAAGSYVGYGGQFVAPKDMRVATIGFGYADGVRRSLSDRGAVFSRGQRLPIVGRVSMDLTTVDATDTSLQLGDWVELFGQQQAAEEVATLCDTLDYELYTNIGARVTRHYQ